MTRVVALLTMLLAAPFAHADIPPPPPPPPPLDATWVAGFAAVVGLLLVGAWVARRVRPRPEVHV
jgi:hypothetical protein